MNQIQFKFHPNNRKLLQLCNVSDRGGFQYLSTGQSRNVKQYLSDRQKEQLNRNGNITVVMTDSELERILRD